MGKRDITVVASDVIACQLGVRRFSMAMRCKLDQKRDEGRRRWNDPTECTEDRLWEMMVDHVKKGDVVDVANFAMMIWNRRNPHGASDGK